MPVPTSITEDDIKAFMASVLGPVATALGYTIVGGSYDEAAIQSLILYGVDDAADIPATGIGKIRAWAKVAIWDQVYNQTVADFDFAADGGDYKRSQVNEQARLACVRAKNDAALFDDGVGPGSLNYAVQTNKIDYIGDPYVLDPDFVTLSEDL